MEYFSIIILKLLPLYVLIALGFVAGRFLKVQRESIAPLLIYIIVPIVIFDGVVSTPLSTGRLSLPFIFFTISCGMSLLALQFGKRFLVGAQKNILSFSCGSGNTGYFGLPVAIYILGSKIAGLALLIGFGKVLFENTLGFFTVARGKHTIRESFVRVLRLPSFYAFLLAIAYNLSGLKMSESFVELAGYFRGAYSVLGMMMVGLGVSTLTRIKLNWRYLSIGFFVKFLVWPAMILVLTLLDKLYFHLFSAEVYTIMFLISLVPLPANAVALAALFNCEEEVAGMGVLVSTFFALFYIPVVISFMRAGAGGFFGISF